jgi:AcrR family transcriptional regulator
MPLPVPVRPARKRRGHYHHGGLREALIQAAVRTIDRDGVDALTLRAVGSALGVSRTALYRHFSDKDSLLSAVAAEGFRTLRDALVRAWAQAGRGLPGLRAMGLAYVRFGIAYPSHYRVMFGGYLNKAAKGSDLETAGSAAFRALVDALVELQAGRVIQADEPLLQARYVWATVHGVTMLAVAGTLGPEAAGGEALAHFALERVERSLSI